MVSPPSSPFFGHLFSPKGSRTPSIKSQKSENDVQQNSNSSTPPLVQQVGPHSVSTPYFLQVPQQLNMQPQQQQQQDGQIQKSPRSLLLQSMGQHQQEQSEEERKLQEKEQKEMHEEIENLSETSSMGDKFSEYQLMVEMISASAIMPVIIISEGGIIKSINQQVTELVGYKRWEIINKNVKILMLPHVARKHDYYLKRYRLSRQARIIGEVRDGIQALHQNGTAIPISLKVNYLSTGGQENRVFIGTISDESTTKSLEWIKSMVHDVFPKQILSQMKESTVEPEEKLGTFAIIETFHDEQMMMSLSTEEEFNQINAIQKQLDMLAQSWGCEKLRSTFNSYVVVCGAYDHPESNPIRTVKFLLEAAVYLKSINLPFRASLSFGSLQIGFTGLNWKQQWSVIGPAARKAKLMVQRAELDEVVINQDGYERISFVVPYAQKVAQDEEVPMYSVKVGDIPFDENNHIQFEFL